MPNIGLFGPQKGPFWPIFVDFSEIFLIFSARKYFSLSKNLFFLRVLFFILWPWRATRHRGQRPLMALPGHGPRARGPGLRPLRGLLPRPVGLGGQALRAFLGLRPASMWPMYGGPGLAFFWASLKLAGQSGPIGPSGP